jgi:DnaJ-class molecular chaperone
MELEIHANSSSSSSNSIALRNEEYNKKRLQGGGSGQGLRVTDPERFARLMQDMKARAEEQKRLEVAREEERKRREGDAYKTPEQRAKEARERKQREQDEGEARVVEGDDGKFDPKVDYYSVLQLDRSASAAEVRAAYKKLALLMHPDKYKSESQEQQDAVARKFVEVSKAFKVLENEEMRAAFDKCRDYMETNPNKGLPTLTPEEQALVMKGAGELSRLKRMGPKLKKHDDLVKKVDVTLEELHFGCTKPVVVERSRVDYSGTSFVSGKTFHLVIRRGSREGDVLKYDEEGDETVDTHAGDLVFRLAVQPHSIFRRRGERDLEMFVQTESSGGIYQLLEIETISKNAYVLVLHSVLEALVRGGCGGTWTETVPGQGLFDGHDKPAGDLVVSARFHPFFLEDMHVTSCIRPGEVALLGSSMDFVGASVVAGYFSGKRRHRVEAMELNEDTSRKKVSVLIVDIQSASNTGSKALIAVRRVFGFADVHEVPVCPTGGVLDDGVWSSVEGTSLGTYDVIVINHTLLSGKKSTVSSEERERTLAGIRTQTRDLMVLVWQHYMRGADVIAIEGAVELLGKGYQGKEEAMGCSCPDILPQYKVRAGGGLAGFDDVITSLYRTSHTTCVGVLEGSAYLVDSSTGEAEMVVAPHRDALIQKSTWEEPSCMSSTSIEEADDDYGFIVAYTTG